MWIKLIREAGGKYHKVAFITWRVCETGQNFLQVMDRISKMVRKYFTNHQKTGGEFNTYISSVKHSPPNSIKSKI